MTYASTLPPSPLSVNWCAVRAWAELHYRQQDLADTFDQMRHWYLKEFLKSQRRAEAV